MSQIASKNMYELLGNDPELDPDRPADPPTRAIDKPVQRTGKRDGSDAPRSTRESGYGNQTRAKQTTNANESSFRDRGIGADKNRNRGSGEAAGESGGSGGRGGQRGRGRGGRGGGRGGGYRGGEGDRRSRTGISDHDKQVAHGWGGNDGDAEFADEQAGEEIAKREEKEVLNEAAEDENQPEPEPEDKSKSYAAYLAEQAEKKLSLAASNFRKPNEGSNTKFPEGTALSRDDEEDAYIAGSGGKTKRERARKEKVHVELDGDRMLAPPPREGGSRGGRGRGRGEFRGGEGRGRGGGGGGEGRGEYRGRGRGDGTRGRGEGRGRGGRGGGQSGPNITDSNAFPSLGA